MDYDLKSDVVSVPTPRKPNMILAVTKILGFSALGMVVLYFVQ
jgi:hypothetical protein